MDFGLLYPDVDRCGYCLWETRVDVKNPYSAQEITYYIRREISIKIIKKRKESTGHKETFSGCVCYLMTLSTTDYIVSMTD
jgi:hypothetical protein